MNFDLEAAAMTVRSLKEKLALKEFTVEYDPDREVSGGYTGDLLSWVMGRALPGHAWVSIMSNRNVAAVAVLAEVSCVILAEGVVPDEDLLARAKKEKIALLGSDKDAFSLCGQIYALLNA